MAAALQHVDRFEREFERLKQACRHARHIVRCFEYGCQIIDGREYPWYSMEFADGGDLADRIADRRYRAPELVPWPGSAIAGRDCREVPRVTSAVAHLHGLGILHRDIKPANVLILDDGSLRLSDFGLVKSLHPTEKSVLQRARQRQRRDVLGTRDYMAIEQAEGRSVDKRTDVYSLGILLAELATGRHPQPQIHAAAGSTLNSWKMLDALPPMLRRFILRCTDVDPSCRPAGGQAALDGFEQIIDSSADQQV